MSEQVRSTWKRGSYEAVAPTYYAIAGHLVERTSVEESDRVLDVGCGTGSVAISAARTGAAVVGVDITPQMLEKAASNARVASVENIELREGDARDLPAGDDQFDVVLSSLGHMYGDPPEATTRELLRVTRPGGHIGFTSWTPTSVYPFMASVLATYLDPKDLPEFSEPPFSWGDSNVVENRLGKAVSRLTFETETVHAPALSPAHFWRETAETSGTFVELLETIDEGDRADLDAEMVDTIRPYFDSRRNGVELEYLLTRAKL